MYSACRMDPEHADATSGQAAIRTRDMLEGPVIQIPRKQGRAESPPASSWQHTNAPPSVRKNFQDIVRGLDEVCPASMHNQLDNLFIMVLNNCFCLLKFPLLRLILLKLHCYGTQPFRAVQYVSKRYRGGEEELQQEEPELAALVHHAHHMEAVDHQALDEDAVYLEDVMWNQNDGAAHPEMEEQQPAAPEEQVAIGLEGGIEEHQQPAAAPQQAYAGVNEADEPPLPQQRPALPGEARWFQENANELPFPGARCTVMQIIMAALTILVDKAVHQTVFDLIMLMVAEALPEGNNWPRCAYNTFPSRSVHCPDFVPGPQSVMYCRSYHVCVKACGTENPRRFEHHMCPNKHCCKDFPDRPRDHWRNHIDEYCTNCGEKRFKIVCGEPHPVKRWVSPSTCSIHLCACTIHLKTNTPTNEHSQLLSYQLWVAGGGTWELRTPSRQSLHVPSSGQHMDLAGTMMTPAAILQARGSISLMVSQGIRLAGTDQLQHHLLLCGGVGLMLSTSSHGAVERQPRMV